MLCTLCMQPEGMQMVYTLWLHEQSFTHPFCVQLKSVLQLDATTLNMQLTICCTGTIKCRFQLPCSKREQQCADKSWNTFGERQALGL